MQSCTLNGLRVYAPASRVELIDHAIEKKAILIAINGEKIANASEEIEILTRQHVGYPDGIAATLMLRRLQLPAIKIPGCELWLDIVDRFYLDKTFYLVGGSCSVIERVVRRLRGEYPEIQISGYRDGYFDDHKDLMLCVDDIALKKPDFIFVAMGSPLQEAVMHRMFAIFPSVYLGLGGSFDIYSGNSKRAPYFLINLHLEWLYRLFKEPLRIKRQVSLLRSLSMLIKGSEGCKRNE